ncbi:helix-turn-helix domain-containing protein [Tannockella kyphosi]|uniref:helix-turn-helix domain-containing protein n=1 Tax=Tannockella kyphosi TaxID=2899121 RepID=UPI0020130DA1|nr:helix-turn-helix transcriptional regulator [Tannockella kyphosi]
MITLSDKLKKAREDKKMTVEELSLLTRISATQIRSIESGKSDLFIGDEQYLKMYLKRIAIALELDEDHFFDEFYAWTQGVSLEQIEEAIASQETKNAPKEKKLSEHVNESIRHAKQKQAYSRNKTHVYEDKYITRFLKYAVIGCLIIALFFLLWKVVSLTNQLEADYVEPNIGSVENNDEVEDIIPEEETEVEEEDDLVSSSVTISSDDGTIFNVGGILEGEIFTLEITFQEETAFSLWNGGMIDGSYKANYQIDEKYTYETTCEPNTTYVLNFWSLENTIVKVNGNIVEYDANDVEVRDGVYYLRIVLTGE